MRTKVLRGRDDRQTLDALGGSLPAAGNGDSPAAVSQPGHAAYLVPTARQRHLWALPDLAVSGGAVPVDEPRALDLLHDAAAAPGTAAELFPGRFPEAVSGLDAGAPGASWFDAERSFLSPGARVAQAVRALDRAGLPSAVQEALSDRLTRVFGCGARAAEAALDRVRAVLDLPWVKSEPQRFDRTHVEQLLGRTHAALDGAKAGVLRFLGSCPQARDLLTFEGPCSCRRADTTDRLPALVVRPGPVQRQAFVLCLAGGRGTGKTSLARAVAEALGRTPVSVSLDGKATKRQIHGSWRDVASGCVVTGLRQTGVNNPLFILEGLDAVGDADAHTDPLLGVLDPSKRTAFTDAYLGVPLDLSGVLWIATATDAGAIPAAVRDCLHVVDLPAYTEQEKVAIAQEHLLARPFDGPLPTPAGVLAVEPDSAVPVGGAPPSGPAAPVLVADRVVSSVEELRGLPAAATAAGGGAGGGGEGGGRRRGGAVAHGGVPRRRPFRAGGDPARDSRLHQRTGREGPEGAACRYLSSGRPAPDASGPAAGHRHTGPRPGVPGGRLRRPAARWPCGRPSRPNARGCRTIRAASRVPGSSGWRTSHGPGATTRRST